jgi:hypothetical protein
MPRNAASIPTAVAAAAERMPLQQLQRTLDRWRVTGAEVIAAAPNRPCKAGGSSGTLRLDGRDAWGRWLPGAVALPRGPDGRFLPAAPTAQKARKRHRCVVCGTPRVRVLGHGRVPATCDSPDCAALRQTALEARRDLEGINWRDVYSVAFCILQQRKEAARELPLRPPG